MKKRIVVNVKKCLGCRSCEIACAVAHSSKEDLISAISSDEKPGYRIKVESYDLHPVPVHCSHCEDATCVLACPTGAAHRMGEWGPVVIDSDRCIGCNMCLHACPFGMIDVSVDGKSVLKCDLCVKRLARGQEPACVEACPSKALFFGDENETNREKRQKVAEGKIKGQ